MTDLINNSLMDNFQNLMEEGIAIPSDAPEISLDNYTRLKEGDNRFRLVLTPVYGAEVWFRRDKINEETGEIETYDDGTTIRENKVLRFAPGENIMIPEELSSWDKGKPRKFIAALVYNYNTKKVEIMTASNKGLFDNLWMVLKKSDDNMNPFKTIITVNKKFDRKSNINGKSVDLYTYTVRQSRETDTLEPDVFKTLSTMSFKPNMNALFSGDDPFDQKALPEATFEEVENEAA